MLLCLLFVGYEKAFELNAVLRAFVVEGIDGDYVEVVM